MPARRKPRLAARRDGERSEAEQHHQEELELGFADAVSHTVEVTNVW